MGSQNKKVHTDKSSTVVQNEQPWLCENGKRLGLERLKEVSAHWDADTWERYLSWFESPMAESLIPERSYDKKAGAMTEPIFVRAQSHADDELRKRVAKVLDGLTPKQRRVVEMTFWSGRSERQIAEDLNLSRSTVKTTKRRALVKLLKLLKASVVGLPRGNGLKVVEHHPQIEAEAG